MDLEVITLNIKKLEE